MKVNEIFAASDAIRGKIAEAGNFDELAAYSSMVEQFETHGREAVTAEAGHLRDLIALRRRAVAA